MRKTFKNLRKKYPRFIYEGFSWKARKNTLRVFLKFRMPPDISFAPRLTIKNIDSGRLEKTDKRIIDNLIFNLGLIELFSYWKAAASKEILVKCGFLNAEQIRFWRDLLIRGLGQYFFENKIDFRKKDFVRIVSSGPKIFGGRKPFLNETFLVPLGGGKDSIVTLEVLKKAGRAIHCFSLNPSPAVKKIMRIEGHANPIIAQRKIDPKLLALNRQGFLNGHTPFSAYLAFLNSLVAVLTGSRYIALSNERSANEGNVRYLGRTINHQYSKSFEFEQKFRKYSSKYLAGGAEYFSFLRPLYELQIAKIFSRFPRYFKVFLSCNQARATNSGRKKVSNQWCGQCPKCLFVFIILRPFLGDKKTAGIFGKNLLKDKKLHPVLEQLKGERGFKPFECVGTTRETKAAFSGKGIEKILSSWSVRNNLTKQLAETLKSYF